MATGNRARAWQRWAVAAVLTVSGAAVGPVPQAAADAEGPPLTAAGLRVDALTDPIGLADTSPTLSWSLAPGGHSGSPAARQTAYQIRVASARTQLGHPDLWDSGKVESSETGNIAYRGAQLRSREEAVWEVRVWDANGRASAWSAPGTWEMGLLSQSDWSAKWIEDPGYVYATDGVPNPLPVFAKGFGLGGRIVKARLYITGLGQYTARLNGLPVTDAVLEPGQTSYWAEVDYRTYDITRLLRPGSNVLGIETGSGVYQQADSTSMGRYMFQPRNNTVFGTPKVIAQLEVSYADGTKQTIATDPSWLTGLGPTTFSSWWGGEDYDARRVPADWTGFAGNLTGSGWRKASLAALTSATIPRATTPLVANPRPPVMVSEQAHPVSIAQVTPPADDTTLVEPVQPGATNVKVASVTNLYPGDNIDIDSGSGMESRKVTAVGTAAGPATTLAAPAAAGDTNVKVTSTGSPCNPGGACTGTTSFIIGQTLLVDSGGSQQAVTVTAVGTAGATGTGVTITPALSAAHTAGTSLRDAGTGITVTPALDLSHADGTAAASVPGPTYVLDFGANLAGLPEITGSAPAGATVTMIPAEQVNSDGTINIASTGASPADFLDEPNWANAVIVIPWELHEVYGDTAVMSQNYDAMVKWLDYEAANKADNGGNIPGLGDWAAAQSTTAQAIIDFGYYRAASTMAKIAQVLGKSSDAATYSTLATSLAAEYNTKYLHTDAAAGGLGQSNAAGDAWYANNTEASNAVALDAGLVPPQYQQAVVSSLVAAVQAYGDRIGTGSVALGPLFRTLHAAGRDDLIYQMVTNPSGPSYASIVNQGATTLWENLTGSGGSKDHQFLGDVAAWLVHDLAGIDQAPGSLEYKQLVIRPAIVGGLTHAAGAYTTPAGNAAVSWTRGSDGRVTLDVTIPANTTAEIWVPASGQPVTAPPGATFSRTGSFDGIQYAVYEAGPGTYRFEGNA